MERKGWRELAPLPLRLVLGSGFAYHGFPKIFTITGHGGMSSMLQGLGFPVPGVTAWLVGALEFFGGIALIAGAFTALIATLGTIEMLVALFMVHLPNGFSFLNITGETGTGPTFGMPGFEVNLLYIAGFLALLLGGAGAFSIDALRSARNERAGRLPVDPVRTVPDRAWTAESERPHHTAEPAGRGTHR